MQFEAKRYEERFDSLDNRIMLATYTVNGQSFVANKPRQWSDHELISPTGDPSYDISPDGKTIVALVHSTLPGGEQAAVKATFLLNFFEELKRRTSAPR